MLKKLESSASWKKAALPWALALAALGGVAVWTRTDVMAAAPKALCGNPSSYHVAVATKHVPDAATNSHLLFCVDSCCAKLNNLECADFELGNTDYFSSTCEAPTDTSVIKLVASGDNTWMGALVNVFGDEVEYKEVVLSTADGDVIDEKPAKHGASYKKQADGKWHFVADVSFEWKWPPILRITTDDGKYADTDDFLWVCVDDCCEKLWADEDTFKSGVDKWVLANCGAPTQASVLKLVASGGYAWRGYVASVNGDAVDFTELVLSTDASEKIAGISAKRGVAFIFVTSNGRWKYSSDVPFDWAPPNWAPPN